MCVEYHVSLCVIMYYVAYIIVQSCILFSVFHPSLSLPHKCYFFLYIDINTCLVFRFMATTAHGGVHTMIGGAGGKDCNAWDKLSKLAGETNVKYFKSTTTLFARNAWRFSLCESPSSEDCIGTGIDGADNTNDECKLQCVGCDQDQFTQDQVDDYLLYMFPFYSPGTDEEAQKVLRTIMCDSKVIKRDLYIFVSLFS